MAAHHIQLQLAKLRLFDVNVREPAEAGVDSVNSATLSDDLLYYSPRHFDADARIGGKSDALAARGDGSDLRQRQFLAVEFEHVGISER